MTNSVCQTAGSTRQDPPVSGPEVHIAGVLIHARPEYAAAICTAITMLPRAGVTHQADDGRIVAVLEAATSREIGHQLDGIRSLRGVLNVAPVYQHAEAEADMDQEMQA